MNSTTSFVQTQIDNLKGNFVDQLTSLIRKVTAEVVNQALSKDPVKIVESSSDGRFSVKLPSGQIISRSRRRDLVRTLKTKGLSCV